MVALVTTKTTEPTVKMIPIWPASKPPSASRSGTSRSEVSHTIDAAQIGVVFSLSSLVFVASSALTARAADRLTRHSVVAVATALLAAFCAIPALLLGVPASLVFLVGASITTGVTISLTFPFGLLAVERGAVTVAVMSALSNIVWASSGMLGPTVGGTFSEWAGDQWAFAVLTVICLVVAVVVARVARRSSPA